MTENYDVILSDGRTIEADEIQLVENARDDGLCNVVKSNYVLCANPDDPDYEYIRDRNCQGKITRAQKVCPECGRRVTEYQSKNKYLKQQVKLNPGGIRDWVRNQIRRILDTNAPTVSRKYGGIRSEYVLDVQSPDINMFLLFENLGEDFIKWMRLYDENPTVLLLDSARSLSPKTDDMEIPAFTINDFYPEPTDDIFEDLRVAESSTLSYRELKASLAHELGSSDVKKEKMDYNDFERVCQNLMMGSIGTSKLLGSAESGSGVPDGAFSLDFNDQNFLYMWDAKFVKYSIFEENETTLSDEYDKIFRHLKDIENRPQIGQKFGQVQGIVLFSPGIKHANIVRLAQFIEEEELLNSTNWNGTVVYFTLGAMLELFDRYRRNNAEVQKKEESLRLALHSYLSKLEKHDDDPEKIAESSHKCIHMSRGDISSMYESIGGFNPEESHFDVDEHMQYLDLVKG